MRAKRYNRPLNKNCWNRFFLLLFLLSTFSSRSQSVFHAGAVTGINGSQLSGDTYSGFNQPGLYAGLFASTSLHERFDLRFEVAFTQKGSRHNPNPSKGDYSDYYLRLNYIEIPLIASFTSEKLQPMRFDLGLAYAVLLNASEVSHYNSALLPRPFHSYDFSGLLGLSYQLKEHFCLHLRAYNSLVPVRAHQSGTSWKWNLGQYTTLLYFGVSYQLDKH